MQAKPSEKAEKIKIPNTAAIASPSLSTSSHTAETEISSNQSQKIISHSSKSIEESQAPKKSQSRGQEAPLAIAGVQEESKTSLIAIAKKPTCFVARIPLRATVDLAHVQQSRLTAWLPNGSNQARLDHQRHGARAPAVPAGRVLRVAVEQLADLVVAKATESRRQNPQNALRLADSTRAA